MRLIEQNALAVGVAEQSPEEIDRLGIGNAVIHAMLAAVAKLSVAPQHLLLDYVPLKECPYSFEALVKGDSRSYSIAAASIVAKVTRDRVWSGRNTGIPAIILLVTRVTRRRSTAANCKSWVPARFTATPSLRCGVRPFYWGMISVSMARVRLGRQGEMLARQYLLDAGYRILATNYRCPWGEIDIIAQEGAELVFVEVRTRRSSGYGSPQESITPEKVEHLHAAAQDYLQNHAPGPRPDELNWRIDLVSVRFNVKARFSADADADIGVGVGGVGGNKSPLIEHLKHAVQL